MRYLLDTNIVSDMIRNPQGATARRIAEVGEDSACTSIIVAGELRFGAAKRGSEKLKRQMERVLERLHILPLDAPAGERYGNLRTQLEARGTPISANDMLIAAHALALGLIMVTDNEREFARVEGLDVENWLRPG